jgi:hypothetical protein
MLTFRARLLAAWFGALLLVLVSGAVMAGGLHYTLDDVYIHLSVAENALRGTWGVNLGEPSSPSSSILYPLLLCLTEMAGLGTLGPLLLAGSAAAAGVALMSGLIETALPDRPTRWLGGLLGLLVTSSVALPLTGMEHSLHVLASLAVLTGLLRLARQGRWPAWATCALIALPFIRFEGLALAGLVLLALVWSRRPGPALTACIAMAVGVAAYAAMMAASALPLIPDSVTSKSTVADAAASGGLAGTFGSLAGNLAANLSARQGQVLALAIPVLGFLWALTRDLRLLPLTLVAMLTVAAHLTGGRIGWFGRYEVYAAAAALAVMLMLVRGKAGQILLLGWAFLAAPPYIETTIRSPAASRNVAEQQYQMHVVLTRFYPKPAAVNDLGWASYRNDAHVLDLWGLGSTEVRTLRAEGRFDAGAMDRLVRQDQVGLAMLYRDWFPEIPAGWIAVADLTSPAVSAGSSTVTFFATSPGSLPEVRAALLAYAQSSAGPGFRMLAVPP